MADVAPRDERVLVVVPALDEEATVAGVVSSVLAVLPRAVVLVVDDHSGDATGSRAAAAGAVVARTPFTMGVGGAMRTGYSYAVRHGFPVVVQVDGDGQHDPRHLPELVAALADDDIVIGARFAGDDPYAVGAARRFAMAALARALSRILHTHLTDVTSGYRALGPRAVRVFAENYPAEYLGDTVEALVIARRCGLSVTQIPVRMTAREHGRPSQGVVGSVVYLGRALAAIGLGLVRRWPCPTTEEPAT
ncbi:glycosyltransferase family 2 protein [Oryzobacter sp. R7]|uniref:glycosyltransferase family 2 protein n=1 Tax=Oryzobacter faecalis TaxID=3388656 RepID=UPI00398CDCBA